MMSDAERQLVQIVEMFWAPLIIFTIFCGLARIVEWVESRGHKQ